MRRTALLAAGTALLAVAACTNAPPLASPAPATQQAAAQQPGPFRIKPLYCGRFSAAQKNRFGTSAKAGFIYRFTDTSATFTGQPQVTVNFTTGATVDGSNVTGDSPSVSPGQNAEGEVDAVSSGGSGLTFTACAPAGYVALNQAGTEAGGTYPG